MAANNTNASSEKRGATGSDETYFPGLPDDTALDVLSRSSLTDYAALACLNKKFNSLIESGYLYELRKKLGLIEHWVYLSSQPMEWEVFDPERRRWKKLPLVPADQVFHCSDKESLAVGSELLMFGRELDGYAVWKYSPLTRKWSKGQPMHQPRCLFGSSTIGEIGIVAGGTDWSGEFLSYAELYDSRDGTWCVLADLNIGRKFCSGFAMDGKFYVIGGMSGPGVKLDCGEEYNMETNTWRRIEEMFPMAETSGRSPPLVAVVDNELYWANVAEKEVWKYNKKYNHWCEANKLPNWVNSQLGGWGVGFRGCGKRLMLVSGRMGGRILVHAWEPGREGAEWEVLSAVQTSSCFLYNCAIMAW